MLKSNSCLTAGKSQCSRNRDTIYVGIDVHKKKNHAALRVDGRLQRTWVMPAGPEHVLASLESLRDNEHHIAYEAGPTGYELVRKLRENQLNADVIAPGKTPRPANEGNKSDSMDCREIARYLEKDMLTPVAIPTRQEEADRQITRLREQVRKKVTCHKQQINSFLLQHNIQPPEKLCWWSKSSVRKLAQMELSEGLDFTLDMHLKQLSQSQQVLQRVEKKIRQMSREDRYCPEAQLVQTHPGVGVRTGMAYLTEIFRPHRFDGPEGVSKILGLAPHVRESGEHRTEVGRIPAGRKGLRRMLVQAAWIWIRVDPWAKEKYKHLVSNTGEPNKAIVGMARRMAAGLWCMITRKEEYIQGGPKS